jgi:tRNA (guanine37-N1)-methyltransferase
MTFDIITAFPKSLDSYLDESMMKRAQERKLITVRAHNLRDFSLDKRHQKIDQRSYGGGPGMVLQVEPIYRAVKKIQGKKAKSKKQKVVLLSAKGKLFDEKRARAYARLDSLVLICGHYEGVDERVAQYVADEEISIGSYVLTGGELPAMVIIDAVSRFVPGVLGKAESLESRRGGETGAHFAYPVYTRPEVFEPKRGVKWRVPKELLTGDHKKIEAWRTGQREKYKS